jgi:hypothetical protein
MGKNSGREGGGKSEEKFTKLGGTSLGGNSQRMWNGEPAWGEIKREWKTSLRRNSSRNRWNNLRKNSQRIEKQPGGKLIETWEKYSEENFTKKWEN